MGHMSRADRIRIVKRETLTEYLSASGHYQYALDALDKMRELAKGEITPESKDRFTMQSAICDKHFRFVDKYLPSIQVDTDKSSASTISALQRAVRAMSMDTPPAITHNPITPGDAVIVPTNIECVDVLVSSSDDVVIPADTASVGSSSVMRVTDEDSSQGTP